MFNRKKIKELENEISSNEDEICRLQTDFLCLMKAVDRYENLLATLTRLSLAEFEKIKKKLPNYL